MKKNKKKIIIFIVLIVVIAAFTYKRKVLNGIYEKNFLEAEQEIEEDGKIKKIKVDFSGWFNPYDKDGKTNFLRLTRHKYGVYIIRDKKTQKIKYIGHSASNLYKTLYRHFQYYSDKNLQYRAMYNKTDNVEICLLLTNKTNAPKLEMALIKEFKPEDAFFKYENIEVKTKGNKIFETLPNERIEFILEEIPF